MPTRHACPICEKPASADHAPFCGQGCRDRDLLKWLGEGYRIPAGPAEIDPDGESGTAGLDRPERGD